MHETLPRGPSGNLGTLPVDQVPVKLTTASVDIHLSSAEPTLTLPEVTGNPEGADDKDGKVSLEKVARGTSLLTGRQVEGRDSSVELVSILVFCLSRKFRALSYLSSQNHDDDADTDPRADDTTSSLEGDLVESVSVVCPGLAETNVGQADGAPGE